MGEIQGEGYELYRPGDMAWSKARENSDRIGEIINRLNALEKQVAEMERAAPQSGAGNNPLQQAREQEAAALGQRIEGMIPPETINAFMKDIAEYQKREAETRESRLAKDRSPRDKELEDALAERDKRGPDSLANQPSLRDSFIDGFHRGWEAREAYQPDIED